MSDYYAFESDASLRISASTHLSECLLVSTVTTFLWDFFLAPCLAPYLILIEVLGPSHSKTIDFFCICHSLHWGSCMCACIRIFCYLGGTENTRPDHPRFPVTWCPVPCLSLLVQLLLAILPFSSSSDCASVFTMGYLSPYLLAGI